MQSAYPPLDGSRPRVHVYSATEMKDTAVRCLENHNEESRPEHVFGDITDRLYPSDLDRLLGILQTHLDDYDILVQLVPMVMLMVFRMII